MTTGTHDRQAKTRSDRRTVAAGLAVSLALHGVLLGGKTAPAPDAARQAEPVQEPPEPVRFSTPVLEVVQLEVETPVKPVVQEIEIFVPAAEPGPAEPSAEPAGAALPSRIALSMRPDFTARHPMNPMALDPVPVPQRAAAEPSDDEEEGRSFWARLGISTGRGGGACPIPRKPGGARGG